MKNRTSWIAILATVLLAVLWWFWPHNNAAQPVNDTQRQDTPTSREQQSSSGDKNGITAADLARIPGNGTDVQKRARILELRQIMDQANQPIQFWGKVVDQDDAPLPGVKVRLSIRHTRERLPGATEDVFDYLDLSTDDQGMFSIVGRKGALLGIEMLVKDGYEAPYVGNRAYWYAAPIRNMQFTPVETRPEVFRMWRKAGAERLVQKGISTRIPYDGRSVCFDLQSGNEVVSGGDLRVALIRTPLQIKRGQQKYDWTATIEALEGGLIETQDEFMYLAPESGYVSKLAFSVSAGDPNWSSDKEVTFFLRSRGGRAYSRVKAKFMTDSEKPMTLFSLESFTNPAGSRNLEYDPLQDVGPSARPQTTTTTPRP